MKNLKLLLTISLTCLSLTSFSQALNGTYTIGGTGPNYTTLTAAVQDLKNKGVSSPVVFKIRDNIYQERLIIPAITGSSNVNTITFQSESGNKQNVSILNATALTSSDHHLVKLDGASNFIFKNLTIQNISKSFASGFHFLNNSNNNIIDNCAIILDSTVNPNAQTLGYIYSACVVFAGVPTAGATNIITLNNSGNNNKIINSTLAGGFIGVIVVGNNASEFVNGNTIEKNNFFTHSISVYGRNNQNLKIQENNFYKILSSNADSRLGFNLDKNFNLLVKGNKMNGLQFSNISNGEFSEINGNIFNSTVSNQPVLNLTFDFSNTANSNIINNQFLGTNFTLNLSGFYNSNFSYNKLNGRITYVNTTTYLNYLPSLRIQEPWNTINGNYIYNPSINGSAFSGVYNTNGDTNIYNLQNNLLITNNVVISGSSRVNADALGFNATSGTSNVPRTLKMYHNSVLNLSADSSGPYVCLFNTLNFRSMDIQNNIFYHKGNGNGNIINIFSGDSVLFDYNLLYSARKKIGYFINKSYKTLNDLIRGTGQGDNCIFSDPLYLSDIDLHTSNSLLDGAVKKIAGVDYDLEKRVRDSVQTDFGAYEINLSNNYDLATIAIRPLQSLTGNVSLIADLRNLGIKSLKGKTISLSYSTNGGTSWSAPESFTISGMENKFDLESFNFNAKWEVINPGIYQACVRINSPGLPSDANLLNDKACGDLCIAISPGTYTIGNTGSDFKTVKEVVDLMVASPCGLVGPITFRIKNGIYNDRILIPNISGLSEKNTITFEGISGIASDVIIRSNSGGQDTNNYTVRLVSTRNLFFKNLSIENTGSAGAYGVHCTGNVNDVSFDNCIFKMDSVYNPLSKYGLYSIFYNINLKINACKFIGGDYGILANPGIYQYSSYYVENCNFIGQTNYGASFQYSTFVSFVKNTIQLNPGNATLSVGLDLNNIDSVIVNKNKISKTGYFGIRITGGLNGSITNNFICDFKQVTAKAYGIQSIGNHFKNRQGKLFICFNSIHYNVAPLNSMNGNFGISFESTKNKNVFQNNIVYNSGGGLAINLNDKKYLEVSNNNDFISSGSVLGTVAGISCTNLSQWQTNSSHDAKSISVNPQFTSIKDLHTSNIALNKKGQGFSFVSDDIDGEARNIGRPDIGADESISDNFDIGLIDILPKNFIFGSNLLSVKIKNFGLKSLVDSSVFLSYSTDNGISWSAPEKFKSSILSATGSEEAYTFTNPVVVNETKELQVKARINSPGLALDIEKGNDSIAIKGCVYISAGTYSVGDPNGIIKTETQLVDVLNSSCGITGPVIFEFINGTYLNNLKFGFIKGSSSINTVTLQSKSGITNDVIFESGNDLVNDYSTINLIGTQNFKIKNVSIKNTGISNAAGVHIGNGAKYIEIENCKIDLDTVYNTGDLFGILISDSSGIFEETSAENISIKNNTITGGSMGMNVFGPPNNGTNKNIQIEFNTIINAMENGIQVNKNSNVLIEKNNISMNKFSGTSIGIFIENSSGNIIISKNKINNISKFGINCTEVSFPIISNNMVAGRFGTNFNSAGIYVDNSIGSKIYFNSVLFDNKTSTNSAAFKAEGSAILEIVNNNFVNRGDGYAYHIDLNNNIKESNNNNLFSSGNILAYLNGDYKKLIDIQNAYSFEMNSVSENPNFNSDYDLHTTSAFIDGKGKNLNEYSEDIDNQIRDNSNPDIGCDEFTNGLDISLNNWLNPIENLFQSDQDSVELKVRISNSGTIAINNFSITCKINGLNYLVDNYTKTINPAEQIDYSFSKKWLPKDTGVFNICAEVDVFNDKNIANNVGCTLVKVSKKGGTFGIEKTQEDFEIALYPNPANEFITIKTNQEKYLVRIFDLSGKLILQKTFGKGDENKINISGLTPGTYFAEIRLDNTSTFGKFKSFQKF